MRQGVGVAFFLKRKWDGLSTAGYMTFSGLASGGGLGFLALGLATHRSLPIFLGVKWLAVSFLLCLLFRRNVIGLKQDPLDEEFEVARAPFKADSPEKLQARLLAMSEQEKRQAAYQRNSLAGLAVFAIGAAVLASSLALTAVLKR